MKRIRRSFFTYILALCIFGLDVAATPLPQSQCSPKRMVATPDIQLLSSSDTNIIQGFTDLTKSADCPDGVPIQVTYLGAVDMDVKILQYAKSDPGDVDFWWASSLLWTPANYVQGQTSIMRTITTFPMDPALAHQLGWDVKSIHTMSDVIDGIRAGAIRLAMPSASQDDTGAMAYLAALAAIKGGDQPLRMEDLSDPAVIFPVKTLLSAVMATDSRADTLRIRFLNDRLSTNPQFNALFISEAQALALNRDLVAKHATPLNIYYLEDATAMSKFPIGYSKNASDAVKAQFAAFVAYLKSDPVQAKLLALGFRTPDIGFRLDDTNPVVQRVFNHAWGVVTNRDFRLALLPQDPVIQSALQLYQTDFKKGSFRVYCMDFSPSMIRKTAGETSGHDQLMAAMQFILDQQTASQYSLQAGQQDTLVILPFAQTVLNHFSVIGNDPVQYDNLLKSILAQQTLTNNTSIYGCLTEAFSLIGKADPSLLASVTLMTDGQHNYPPNYQAWHDMYVALDRPVPVYSIQFGQAVKSELDSIAKLTNGQVCDGRGGQENFIACFKLFKGSQ